MLFRNHGSTGVLPPALGGLLVVAVSLAIEPLHAQQYIVDDDAIVDRGACHVEAWHGRRASWILPACQPARNLELAVGVEFVDDGEGQRETEYAIEAKTLLRPLAPNDWGIGAVFGVGPNPIAVAGERRLGDVYAFLPVSLSLRDDRLILHGNVGWAWDRETPTVDDHHVTWGARADLNVAPALSLLAEFAGEDDEQPEYQAGVRIHLPAAGVEVDLSWGGHIEAGRRGAGFTVGAQFVSGRIF